MAQEESSSTKKISPEEVESLLDINAGSAVVTPSEKENSVFTNTIIKDEVILDEALSEEEKAAKKGSQEKDKLGEEILENIIKEDTQSGEEEEEEGAEGKGGGSQGSNEKEIKDGGQVVKALSQLIKEGVILPFEGETPIEEYNAKDIAELIKTNLSNVKEANKDEVLKEFFESISPDLQHLAKFELDGGSDLKGEMRKLLTTLEVRELDPSKEEDQDRIIEQWLTMINFGTPEDIKAEVLDIRDRGKSEEKAKQYKPKVDAKNAEHLSKEAAKQEAIKAKRIEATKKYSESIYNTLVKGDLGGIKLTKKVQDMIYNGLTESQYPSITGKPTTKLGHLLEKFQVLEPDHAKIAKVMWILEDEAGYEEALKNKGSVDTNEKIVKQLKRAESEKDGSAQSQGSSGEDEGRGRKVVVRKKKSIFDRD